MKNVEFALPLQSIWERRAVNKKSWQTEGSPLVLFSTLRANFISAGCSVDAVNTLIPLGTFVDSAFLASGKESRQEEKKVAPVVHSYRVALRFLDSIQLTPDVLSTYTTIALLHDVLEDTPVTLDTLRQKFGDKIAQGVIALSKHVNGGKKLSNDEYYAKLENADREIQWIKVADRIENLSVFLRMSNVPELLDPKKFSLPSNRGIMDAMRENLAESRQYVVALAQGNPSLKKELESVMYQTEKRLKQLQTQKRPRLH